MSQKERVIICKGKKVSLVVPEKEDVELWYKGINNLEINQYLTSGELLYSYEQEIEYYENSAKDKNNIKFTIYVNDKKKVIGNVDLLNLSHFNKNSCFGIAIWDKKYTNNGYGSEALRLFLDYAFKVQGLRKIHASCHGDNPRALTVYKKVGFKEVGIYKEQYWKQGKYIDLILIEIFKDEFYEINKEYFEKLKNR